MIPEAKHPFSTAEHHTGYFKALWLHEHSISALLAAALVLGYCNSSKINRINFPLEKLTVYPAFRDKYNLPEKIIPRSEASSCWGSFWLTAQFWSAKLMQKYRWDGGVKNVTDYAKERKVWTAQSFEHTLEPCSWRLQLPEPNLKNMSQHKLRHSSCMVWYRPGCLRATWIFIWGQHCPEVCRGLNSGGIEATLSWVL